MKTISAYRQSAISKKPKYLFLITFTIAFAFLTGALVGTATPIFTDWTAAGGEVLDSILTLYQGIVARDVPLLVQSVGNFAQLTLTEVDPDLHYCFLGP